MAAFVSSLAYGSRQMRRERVTCSASRRQALRCLILAPGLLLPKIAQARVVKDESIGFEFTVPENWKESNSVLSGGRKLYLYIKDDVNVSAVATPIAGDYQRLTSFGGVDTVAKTILPNQVNGKMNNIDTKPDRYIFDYNITPPNNTEKHLITLFTMRPGKCIVTITAQCDEKNFANLEPEMRSVIKSFVLQEERGYD
eukprot:Plantae.Rhodophyta-Purpureofilum_apyrenoidigerum.ctg16890.p1 GENE.Plantae.Rhodophyta-Purpureofilum_apyrenoidigerum.ctg16890~~Plantae.Rhodophyta-Purpureofilum_apyrenoidigerum.ctg16890.p1  ORF type:complete len:198 (+),score=30.42 Plantae.Rhodophyta-Purpureofilum_apyrenoidigerum.ctg16890:136-729(+)